MRSIVEAIFTSSGLYPERDAMIFQDTAISYSELARKIKAFAFALKSKKISKGSRIIIEADDLISYFCAFLGCQLYGCIAVPVEKNISIYKLQDLLKATKPKLVFMKNNGEAYRDYFSPAGESARRFPLPKPDSICAIISTTGTTGKPSLVSHTNRSMAAEIENLAVGTDIDAYTVLFTNFPFELAAGYRRVMAALSCGATAILSNGAISAPGIAHIFQKYPLNRISLISSDLPFLIDYANGEQGNPKNNLNKIKCVESAAGELPSEIITKFYQKFPDAILYNVYGTTESGCILINNTRENYSEKCLGKPACNAKITLTDEKGKEITEAGKYGYVTVAGDMNMDGYYKKKDLTEKVMANGKLVLNDIVYFDENGYYYFVSRVGDIINVKGHKITPFHVEKAALESGLVKDCACVAKGDPASGQIPVLYVECPEGEAFDAGRLAAYLEQNLEPYCVPAQILPIKKIPRTTTGKLMRRSLALAPSQNTLPS